MVLMLLTWVYVLRVGVVVLHGHLHRHAVFLGIEVDDRVDDRRPARGVEVAHELLEPLLRVEPLRAAFARFVLLAPVREAEVYALVQKRQLAQTVGQNVVLVFGRVGEDFAVGLERYGRTAVRAFAYDLHRRRGRSLAVGLPVDLAFAVHLGDEKGRERIDARDAHAVQTARDLVTALVELAARVQYGEHHFERRLALFLVEVGRDAAAVVAHGDRVVLVDRYVDMRAVACERFVDRVVHDLVDEVVESLFADVADIHGRTFAHRFEPFQHLDIGCGVLFVPLLYVFFCTTHWS